MIAYFLDSYSIIIAEIETQLDNGLDLEEAIKVAVLDCIKKGIMPKFLSENISEVENMIFGEYDEDEARLASFEDGVAEGIEKGQINGIKKVAIGLISKDIDINIIAETTGLSLSEIEELSTQ